MRIVFDDFFLIDAIQSNRLLDFSMIFFLRTLAILWKLIDACGDWTCDFRSDILRETPFTVKSDRIGDDFLMAIIRNSLLPFRTAFFVFFFDLVVIFFLRTLAIIQIIVDSKCDWTFRFFFFCFLFNRFGRFSIRNRSLVPWNWSSRSSEVGKFVFLLFFLDWLFNRLLFHRFFFNDFFRLSFFNLFYRFFFRLFNDNVLFNWLDYFEPGRIDFFFFDWSFPRFNCPRIGVPLINAWKNTDFNGNRI